MEQTIAVATNLVTVGLAIQSALVRQKKVMQATLRTRKFLGDLVVANGEAIRMHTIEIGDLYTSPVIAIEKIVQAHDELVEAMDMTARFRQEGIAIARENIVKLSQLSAELEKKVEGLPPDSADKPHAIEA